MSNASSSFLSHDHASGFAGGAGWLHMIGSGAVLTRAIDSFPSIYFGRIDRKPTPSCLGLRNSKQPDDPVT